MIEKVDIQMIKKKVMFLRNWLFLLGFGVWGKLGFTFAG